MPARLRPPFVEAPLSSRTSIREGAPSRRRTADQGCSAWSPRLIPLSHESARGPTPNNNRLSSGCPPRPQGVDVTVSTAPLVLPHGPAWSNRFALAALTNQQSAVDGRLRDDEYRWLVRRAHGGFGMVRTCATHVSPEGQVFPGQLGIYSDDHLPGLARLARGVRDGGAAAIVQLHHGGRRALPALTGRPVACPYTHAPSGAVRMSEKQIGRAVGDFVAAAVRAETAGFDGVEVHGAHGYLLAQFLDGTNNTRTDGYGGSLTDRTRVLLEVLSGIRSATGPDFQVGLRLSTERQGIVLAEARVTAAEVLASGLIDFLDLSLWDAFKGPAEPGYDGWLLDHFTDLPRHGVALGAAGGIRSAAQTHLLLDRGLDYVSVGTAAIIHHDFPRRVTADPQFRTCPIPIPREALAAEDVGPRFIDYLAAGWDDFVATA
ncbi:NADH:flavin oxidoreductase [Nocardioides sp. BGMRC 2183]|nr:NADH:flavin oxidoreductase [Nocardioides sp. BGMRC 2183]